MEAAFFCFEENWVKFQWNYCCNSSTNDPSKFYLTSLFSAYFRPNSRNWNFQLLLLTQGPKYCIGQFIKHSVLFSRKINIFHALPKLLKKWLGGEGQGCSKIQYSFFGPPGPSLTSSSPPHSFNLCAPYHNLSAMLPKTRCKWGEGGWRSEWGIGDCRLRGIG